MKKSADSEASPGLVRLSNAPPDAELIRRIALGDPWAQEAFYRRYVSLVGATALRLLRHRAEAEDVVQETFLIAFAQVAELRDTEALRGWLVRIAMSRAHRRLRWNKLRRMFGMGFSGTETLEDEAQDGASAEDRAELSLIDEALSKLKEPPRTAWLLRHALGLTLEEAAVSCQCSLTALKRRVKLAEDHVQRHIERGGRHGRA